MTKLVTVTIDDLGIAQVVLNRPDKLNALNMELFVQLNQTIKKLKKNKHLRAVIVSGQGNDFCTGLDIKNVMNNPLNAVKLLFKWWPGSANLAQKVSFGWRSLPVPVIMNIHGRCWGGGMQIALGGDFRIADVNASLSIMEAKWGLIPDMAGNTALRHLMPMDKALKLAMTGEKLTAQQAMENNLITQIAENSSEASYQLAKELIQTSPDVLAALKKLYRKHYSGTDGGMLAKESGYQIKILAGKNRIVASKKAQGKEADFVKRQPW